MDWCAHVGGYGHGYFLCLHLDVGPACLKRTAQAAPGCLASRHCYHASESTRLQLKIQVLDSLQLGLSAVFLIQLLFMIWIHIGKENEVTIDLIMAAACAYILIGVVWAYAYYLLERFHPHSFKASENMGDDIWNFYYYSFVTLNTVGYGDIVAITKSARALSILEAIFGQLYLAIMISRLVGLHASQAGIGKGK